MHLVSCLLRKRQRLRAWSEWISTESSKDGQFAHSARRGH